MFVDKFLLLYWPFAMFLLSVKCHLVDSFCSYSYSIGTTCSISDDVPELCREGSLSLNCNASTVKMWLLLDGEKASC